MADETRNQLKTYFETGDIPTQAEFGNLIDSSINKIDDKITIVPDVVGNTTQVGINTTEPHCPLAIRSNNANTAICVTSFTPGTEFHIAVNPSDGTTVYNGLDINEGGVALNTSRVFIEKGTGMIGIGTTDPQARLHLKDASIESATSLKIENAEVNNGPTPTTKAWQLGQIHDSGLDERNGSFSVMEENAAHSLNERITLLPGKNMGVNNPLPTTVLHVYGNPMSPESTVQLLDGTGIVTIGPSDGTNLVLDFNAIQARLGTSTPSGVTEDVSNLDLQPLGGEITFHTSFTEDDKKVVIKDDGKIGVGISTPGEKLHLNGAMVVGTTTNIEPVEGTIRYNPVTSDLEGFVSGVWSSLTGVSGSGGFWQSAGDDQIKYNTPNAKVAVGTEVPTAALHVSTNSDTTEGNSVASIIENTSVTSNPAANGNRIGLQVDNSLQWSSSDTAKNVGITVRSTGMPNAQQNIAAVLSGNVVVGKLNAEVVGVGSENVLAIQNGAVPAGPVGAGDDGIQLYSANRITTEISTFHVMNGDGTVLRLYRQTNNMTVPIPIVPDSGDTETDTLIANMVTRINELETILKNLGVLA